MNEVVKIQHKTRPIINEFNWDETNSDVTSFKAYVDGEIYADEKTNVLSYTIDGNPITFPFAVLAGVTYPISVVKSNQNAASQLKLIQRIADEKSIIKNVPQSIDNAVQSTKSYFIHPADNKVTIVDSTLINDDNFIADTNWTNNPKTVIDLPVYAYCIWETAFYDHVHGNRMIIVGRDTNDTRSFYLCGITIDGVNADQVWNIEEDTQNGYNQFAMDTNSSTIYPYINYLEDTVYLYSGRLYKANLSNLLSWSYLSNDTSRNYLKNRRKYEFSTEYNSFVGYPGIISVPSAAFLDFYYPRSESYVYATAIDNITGNVYIGTDSVSSPYVWNNKVNIATVGSLYRCRGICLSSKNRVGLIYPSSSASYSNHMLVGALINLDSVTTIRREEIFTDADVAGTSDGEYLDCLGLFCVLSNGNAGTQGRKLVYYINSQYDGVNPILKYKLLLDYEAFHVYTNRIRN